MTTNVRRFAPGPAPAWPSSNGWPAGSRWISHQYRDATQLLSPILASISSISKLSRLTMQGMPNVGSQLHQNSHIRKCDWLVRKKNLNFGGERTVMGAGVDCKSRVAK